MYSVKQNFICTFLLSVVYQQASGVSTRNAVVSQGYTADGCKRQQTYYDEQLENHDSLHAVRCCSVDGSSCTSKIANQCYNGKSYFEAYQLCEGIGLRLCSINELETNMCCSTGCNHDNRRVWTSDSQSTYTPSPEPTYTNIQIGFISNEGPVITNDFCLSQDCSGHGTCSEGDTSHICSCDSGWEGTNCETETPIVLVAGDNDSDLDTEDVEKEVLSVGSGTTITTDTIIPTKIFKFSQAKISGPTSFVTKYTTNFFTSITLPDITQGVAFTASDTVSISVCLNAYCDADSSNVAVVDGCGFKNLGGMYYLLKDDCKRRMAVAMGDNYDIHFNCPGVDPAKVLDIWIKKSTIAADFSSFKIDMSRNECNDRWLEEMNFVENDILNTMSHSLTCSQLIEPPVDNDNDNGDVDSETNDEDTVILDDGYNGVDIWE
eukprot:Awhi_evm1s8091